MNKKCIVTILSIVFLSNINIYANQHNFKINKNDTGNVYII